MDDVQSIFGHYFPTKIFVSLSLMHACIYAANCHYPTSVDDSVSIIGYNAPMLEGSNITLSCYFGYAITSTCMENGKWEPDPRNLKCTGKLV